MQKIIRKDTTVYTVSQVTSYKDHHLHIEELQYDSKLFNQENHNLLKIRDSL